MYCPIVSTSHGMPKGIHAIAPQGTIPNGPNAALPISGIKDWESYLPLKSLLLWITTATVVVPNG